MYIMIHLRRQNSSFKHLWLVWMSRGVVLDITEEENTPKTRLITSRLSRQLKILGRWQASGWCAYSTGQHHQEKYLAIGFTSEDLRKCITSRSFFCSLPFWFSWKNPCSGLTWLQLEPATQLLRWTEKAATHCANAVASFSYLTLQEWCLLTIAQ